MQLAGRSRNLLCTPTQNPGGGASYPEGRKTLWKAVLRGAAAEGPLGWLGGVAALTAHPPDAGRVSTSDLWTAGIADLAGAEDSVVRGRARADGEVPHGAPVALGALDDAGAALVGPALPARLAGGVGGVLPLAACARAPSPQADGPPESQPARIGQSSAQTRQDSAPPRIRIGTPGSHRCCMHGQGLCRMLADSGKSWAEFGQC